MPDRVVRESLRGETNPVCDHPQCPHSSMGGVGCIAVKRSAHAQYEQM